MDLGYKGDHIAYNKERILEGDHLNVAVAWLRNFENIQVKAYTKAKGLVPESVWIAHKTLNNRGTYEQKQLKDAKENLINVWKTRPSILHRTKVTDQRGKQVATGRDSTIEGKSILNAKRTRR